MSHLLFLEYNVEALGSGIFDYFTNAMSIYWNPTTSRCESGVTLNLNITNNFPPTASIEALKHLSPLFLRAALH
jgi:hypothetical protein